MLGEWLSRLRFFFTGKSRTEVDDEIRFHMERQVEANLAAGMSAAEARRQAAISFGGRERSTRAVPRAAAVMVGRVSGARYPLWRSRAVAQSRLYRGCGAHTGAGHRRQFHHLQPAQPGADARAPGAES